MQLGADLKLNIRSETLEPELSDDRARLLCHMAPGTLSIPAEGT